MEGNSVTGQDRSLRESVRVFIEHEVVRNAILAVIIFNAITLGVSTSQWAKAHLGGILPVVDDVVLTIFIVELSLKFYAQRLSFFRSAWNLFDLAVVTVGLLPATESLSALRALRVIRALRLLSIVPQMRAVVQALFDALPGMGAVIIMLAIVYYVFAVMATIIYGQAFDEWFGTIGRSAYSLFQIMTLESWSMGIVRPVMKEFPNAWAFFVPFIVITAFSVLNLFIGLLVNTMQSAVAVEEQKELELLTEMAGKEFGNVDAHLKALAEEVKALRSEVAALRGVRDG